MRAVSRPHRKEYTMVAHTTDNPKARKIPQYINGRSFVGNLPDFNKDRLGLLQRMANTSDVCGMHLGPFPAILFNKPEHVHSIFVERASDFHKRRAVHVGFRSMIGGDGLLSSEGDFHRHQRKLVAPSFQPRHMANHAESIGHCSEQIQQTWPDGGIIDIDQQMTHLTMSITGKALFDADVFTEKD